MRFPGSIHILYLLLAAPVAAGSEPSPYIDFEGERLARGKTLWMKNCEGCHGYGIAGAPVPTQAGEWAPRLKKGKETLYEHAINGFFGPEDTMMPERGGNPDLTDDEVRAAVDYMVALAAFYIEKTGETK